MKKALKIAAWALLVLAVLLILLLWGLFEIMSPDPHEYLKTPGPGGQVAHLERPGGSMEPIYYSVKVERPLKGDCTAVRLEGYEAERWVRLGWDGAALVLRYGLPRNPEAKGLVPTIATGEDACSNLSVRLVEDASLVPQRFLGDPLAPPDPDQALSPALAAEIEAACGLPSGALAGDAPVSDAMPKMACALEEARKHGVPFGFVSNPVDPDAQTN